MHCRLLILSILLLLSLTATHTHAQQGPNDTIRLGAIVEHGQVYAMILLDEHLLQSTLMDSLQRAKQNRLRNDIYTVYPYAIAAGDLFRDINTNLQRIGDDRHARKVYLKSIDKRLDVAFKKPLKNLSIDQGHIIIKLINRQTGQNCYSIIKEMKGGFTAMMWQSLGVLFNNNLNHNYDPEGDDHDIEVIVKDLEASNAYKYQLYQQQALIKKVKTNN